jgi:nitroreductase
LFERAEAVAERLGIPDGMVPIGMVALGYESPSPAEPGRSASRARKGLDEVVHRGHW